MLTALVDAIHMLAVLAILAGLLISMVASKPLIASDDLRSINVIYTITGIALLVAAIAGMVLWLSIGKPAEFYSNNPVFHSKMGLFTLLLLLSGFLAHRFRALQHEFPAQTSGDNIPVPALLRRLQKVAFALVLVIPVLAWMMARGIGY